MDLAESGRAPCYGRRGRGGKRRQLVEWLCFQLDTKAPPASTIGATYKTVDERCGACVVNGGIDGTCVDWSIELQQQKGRPCPRVDLDPDLGLVAEVLLFAKFPDTKALGPAHFEALAESLELSTEQRLEVLRRLHATLTHPDVLLRLHPRPSLPDDD